MTWETVRWVAMLLLLALALHFGVRLGQRVF